MQNEDPAVRNLRETLQRHHQNAGKYVDFTDDLNTCTWDVVRDELRKAQAAAVENERRGKTPVRKAWRILGTTSLLAPGQSALPNELSVLNGGLAVIFSVS